eukprot:Phypoly_transcript_01724.p1 GENE.Phypoly_transcript_01724~~Phypoly_transcript_01724.p1  ORF type:complete len:779 (+),score=90.87 Phypoly_transcript_01724:158-2494(+)
MKATSLIALVLFALILGSTIVSATGPKGNHESTRPSWFSVIYEVCLGVLHSIGKTLRAANAEIVSWIKFLLSTMSWWREADYPRTAPPEFLSKDYPTEDPLDLAIPLKIASSLQVIYLVPALVDINAWQVDLAFYNARALVLAKPKARPPALEAYSTPYTDPSSCARASVPTKGKFTDFTAPTSKPHYEIFESILSVYRLYEDKIAAVLIVLLCVWICYIVACELAGGIREALQETSQLRAKNHPTAQSTRVTQRRPVPVCESLSPPRDLELSLSYVPYAARDGAQACRAKNAKNKKSTHPAQPTKGVSVPHKHAAQILSGDHSSLSEETLLESLILWSTDEPAFVPDPSHVVDVPECSSTLATMPSTDSILCAETLLESVIIWSTNEPEFPHTIPALESTSVSISGSPDPLLDSSLLESVILWSSDEPDRSSPTLAIAENTSVPRCSNNAFGPSLFESVILWSCDEPQFAPKEPAPIVKPLSNAVVISDYADEISTSQLPAASLLESTITWSSDTTPALNLSQNNAALSNHFILKTQHSLLSYEMQESILVWSSNEPDTTFFEASEVSESNFFGVATSAQETQTRTISDFHLFLDIDGTLVHSIPGRLHAPELGTPDFTVEEIFGVSYKRPGVDAFLAFCFENFKSVSIWTAGTAGYAQAIARRLAPQGRSFALVLSRETLGVHPTKAGMRSKNMTTMWASNPEFLARRICAANSLIIDDTPDACAWNMTNTVIVPSWISTARDDSCFPTLREVFAGAQVADAAELCEVARVRLCAA